jgi:hypothetical protein
MSPEWVVTGLAGFLAVMMLTKLMQRRQKQLMELLSAYSSSQLEWSRKKNRAALLARRAALQKADDNDLSALTEMLSQPETQEAPAQ